MCRLLDSKLRCDSATAAELEAAWGGAARPSAVHTGVLLGAIGGMVMCAVVMCARYAPGPRWLFARSRVARILSPAGFLLSALLAISLAESDADRPASFVIFEGRPAPAAMRDSLSRPLRQRLDHSDPFELRQHPILPAQEQALGLSHTFRGALHLDGRPMLLVDFKSVRPDQVSWNALVDAETLSIQWFDDACLGFPLQGRIISPHLPDILVFRPDRTLERTLWSQEWLPSSWWVYSGRIGLVTNPDPPEAPRVVSLDPVRADVEEWVVSREHAARFPRNEALAIPTEYEILLDGLRVIVSGGRAVATSDDGPRWDREAKEWFRVYDYLYEFDMQEWPNGTLRRLDPGTGAVSAELSGATLRADDCFAGGSGCPRARAAVPPDPRSMSPTTSAPTRLQGSSAIAALPTEPKALMVSP